MKINVYSIFDEAAKAYITPFFMQNNALATRAFKDQCNTPGSQIASNPEQFVLFHIAEYDDSTGTIVPRDTPRSLGRGNEYSEREAETRAIDDLLSEIRILADSVEKLTNKEK